MVSSHMVPGKAQVISLDTGTSSASHVIADLRVYWHLQLVLAAVQGHHQIMIVMTHRCSHTDSTCSANRVKDCAPL